MIMANTFTQIYILSVFAVKGRENIISKTWKDELYKYITGIVHYSKGVIKDLFEIQPCFTTPFVFHFPVL